jgi:hypothetical protein
MNQQKTEGKSSVFCCGLTNTAKFALVGKEQRPYTTKSNIRGVPMKQTNEDIIEIFFKVEGEKASRGFVELGTKINLTLCVKKISEETKRKDTNHDTLEIGCLPVGFTCDDVDEAPWCQDLNLKNLEPENEICFCLTAPETQQEESVPKTAAKDGCHVRIGIETLSVCSEFFTILPIPSFEAVGLRNSVFSTPSLIINLSHMRVRVQNFKRNLAQPQDCLE